MNANLHIISLPQSIAQLQRCQAILSLDETERMLRFATPKLQDYFALTRGHLRLTLGKLLNADPEKLEFIYNEFGKPFLKNHSLQFNLAHSKDYCVIATSHTLVGVDIEYCENTHKPHLDIAKRFFTQREFQAIETAQDPELLFFHIWTQKEAFLKAIGKGISFGLDQFEVATCLDESYVKDIQDPEYSALNWKSQSYDSIQGYRLTVTSLFEKPL